MIFPTESLHGLHSVPDAVLAFFAFRGAESYVTRLAIWVSLVHGKADIVVLKLAITLERDASRTLCVLTINAWRQEWVAALGAEEVLLVIRALSKLRVIKGNEAFIYNRRLAVIAPWRKTLVVIKMAIRFTVTLVGADIFEQVITVRAPEAAWVPPNTHRTDNAPNNWTATTATCQATTTTSR